MIDDWKKSERLRSSEIGLKDEEVFLSMECKNILLTWGTHHKVLVNNYSNNITSHVSLLSV